jgi:hypothetical protein
MRLTTRAVLLAAALAAAVALPIVAPAQGDVGIEKVSRHGAEPGATVSVTVGCGFCFPPCKGEPGHRNAPCMLDTDAEPPRAFPISLVPIGRAPEPHRCGPRALCSPEAKAPPSHGPYRYLGRAVAAKGGASDIPRYVLDFEVPDLRPGLYAYVLYCGACTRGSGGSLIALPYSRPWQLRVR